MELDPKIIQAIQGAVSEAGQSDVLAGRLVAWMDAVTSGNEDPVDLEATARRLELLYSETVVRLTDEELE
jgi:hypothetical protein